MDATLPVLLPAALAATACLLAVGPPGGGLRRIAGAAPGRRRPGGAAPGGELPGGDIPGGELPRGGAPGGAGSAWVRAARGRPGAPPVGRRVWLGTGAGAAVCLVASRLLDLGWWPFLGWPLLAAAGGLLLGVLEPRSAQLRTRRLVADVPQALELLADGLAAGLPLRGACATVIEAFEGPVAEELGSVLRSVELGVGDAAAWQALARHPQLGPAAADVARAAESGTELVTALRHHAAAARERRRAALQQRARGVGVRSVLPLMTCFLPAFLLLGVVPTVISALDRAFG